MDDLILVSDIQSRTASMVAVLNHLVDQGCLFGVLHGAEGLPETCGRDLDLFVTPEGASSIRHELVSFLSGQGWEVGFSRMEIGIDQVFATCNIDGRQQWLEIDLIHHHPFCWRGQVLVPVGLREQDLGMDHGFPCYVWGWFAKNLIMQLVAGKEEKFRRNLSEFRKKEDFAEKVRKRGRELGLKGSVELILRLGDDFDFESLRDQCRRQIMASLLVPRRVWMALCSVIPWVLRTYRLYFPGKGCVPVLHLVSDDEIRVKRLAGLLSDRIKETFPFPNIKVSGGVAGKSPSHFLPNRLKAVARGGWERDRRDSSWLTLLIYWWIGSDDTENLLGEKVTPGDLVVRVESEDEVERISEKLKPAFMMNLEKQSG